MPDGTDWGLAWIRLERAIQKKIDKLDNGKADENADYRDAVAEMSTLEEVQELMAKFEPKERKHERLWGKASAMKKYGARR
jgi:hypothetical protein